MKKILYLLLLVFVSNSLFAVNGYDTINNVITAYKIDNTGGVPEKNSLVRIIDNDGIEVSENGIELPLEARGADYSAFSWNFTGNVWGEINLNLKFNPLVNDLDATQTIPYVVKVNHISTKIGNNMINLDGNVPSLATKTYVINGSSYDMYYSDSVSFKNGSTVTNSLSVGSSSATISCVANMSTNSQVKSNGSVVSYSYDVCDSWNRLGSASINLTMPSSPASGVYVANVELTITVN